MLFNNSKTKVLTTASLCFITLGLSAQSTAQDIQPQQIKPNKIVQTTTAQLNNHTFVFNAANNTFDWNYFFTNRAPHLASYKESFTHWVGFHSINPTLVLAIMDMQSGAISNRSSKLDSPFGHLSQASSFNEQLNDVLGRLNRSFYAALEHQKGANTQPSLSAATQAVQQLFGNTNRAQKTTEFSIERLLLTHQSIFGNKQLSLVKTNNNQQTEATEKVPNITLQLPWSKGYSWSGGGSHGYDGSTGPHSSIDYAYDWPAWGGQTWSVRSAHSGTVTVLSSCQVRVTNSSGWATNYYHLSNVPLSNGQYINANTHLGYYASDKNQALCQGGQSTGPHLHFSLLKDGYYYSLDDVVMSNYKVNTGRWHYDSDCYNFYYDDYNTGSYKCAWNSMYNY